MKVTPTSRIFNSCGTPADYIWLYIRRLQIHPQYRPSCAVRHTAMRHTNSLPGYLPAACLNSRITLYYKRHPPLTNAKLQRMSCRMKHPYNAYFPCPEPECRLLSLLRDKPPTRHQSCIYLSFQCFQKLVPDISR